MTAFEVWGHGPLGPTASSFEQQFPQRYLGQPPPAPYLGYRHGPIGQPVQPLYTFNPCSRLTPPAPLTYYSSQGSGFGADPECRDLTGIPAWPAQKHWAPIDQTWCNPQPRMGHFGQYGIENPAKLRHSKPYPDDDDHPSFARPPHRPVEKTKSNLAHEQVASKVIDFVSIEAPESLIEEDEILVPNSYPVPPPPPYADSAAPLSEFAAEFVWNRCFVQQLTRQRKYLIRSNVRLTTDSSDSFPSIWMSRPTTTPGRDRRPTVESPGSGNFGAIGVEVKARRASRDNSNARSPPSPALDTPATSKAGIKPAFRRWCKQILEATLLSPQVLMLALMYVDAVSDKDVFGESKNQMTPYKMLMAALVLANKTLDDHSYKNSTFANVSSMTNTEVNNVEVALLLALDFNIVPQQEEWVAWLHDAIEFGNRTGLKLTGTKVDDLVPYTVASTMVDSCDMPMAAMPVTRSLSCFSNQGYPSDYFPRLTPRASSFCGVVKDAWQDCSGASSLTNKYESRRFGQELSNRQSVIGF